MPIIFTIPTLTYLHKTYIHKLTAFSHRGRQQKLQSTYYIPTHFVLFSVFSPRIYSPNNKIMKHGCTPGPRYLTYSSMDCVRNFSDSCQFIRAGLSRDFEIRHVGKVRVFLLQLHWASTFINVR